MQKKRVFLLLIFITAFLLLIGLGGEVKAYTLNITIEPDQSEFSSWWGFEDKIGDIIEGKDEKGIEWKATILKEDKYKILVDNEPGEVKIEIKNIPETLTEVEIPSSIKLKINSERWYILKGQHEYNYNVTTIENNALKKCSNVKKIVIPGSVTAINASAFYGCEKLKEIDVANNNNSFKDIGGILLSRDGKNLVYYPQNKNGIKYTIPAGVTKVGEYAFASNNKLEEINIPANVNEIGDYAFYETNISKMNIPNTVTKLGKRSIYEL